MDPIARADAMTINTTMITTMRIITGIITKALMSGRSALHGQM